MFVSLISLFLFFKLNYDLFVNIYIEWSGEVRSITYSGDAKSVSVVYRVTLYGTDAEVLLLLLSDIYECYHFYRCQTEGLPFHKNRALRCAWT